MQSFVSVPKYAVHQLVTQLTEQSIEVSRLTDDKVQHTEKLHMQRQQEYEKLYLDNTELQSRYQHLWGVMQAVSAGVNNPANGQLLAIFTSLCLLRLLKCDISCHPSHPLPVLLSLTHLDEQQLSVSDAPWSLYGISL